jgi:hypothetical protein
MLTPGGPPAPGYRVRQRPAPAAPDCAEDVGVVLNGQWPGPPRGPATGMPALAHAVLANACLDAGLARRRGPVAQRDRWSAARYLLEADAAVPLPLETACALADLDADHVRALVRLQLR